MHQVTDTLAASTLGSLIDDAARGDIVTITREGHPVAALVSPELASIAEGARRLRDKGLVAHLATFPEPGLERNRTGSRDADL